MYILYKYINVYSPAPNTNSHCRLAGNDNSDSLNFNNTNDWMFISRISLKKI